MQSVLKNQHQMYMLSTYFNWTPTKNVHEIKTYFKPANEDSKHFLCDVSKFLKWAVIIFIIDTSTIIFILIGIFCFCCDALWHTSNIFCHY